MFEYKMEIGSLFDELGQRVKKVDKQVMSLIGQLVVSDIHINFRNEKAPNGEKWKPLANSTIRRKIKKSGVVRMLQDTGNLKNSLNYNAYTNKVKIGYGAKYSVFHQMGTRYMPIRKILPTKIDEIDLNSIKDILDNYLRKGL